MQIDQWIRRTQFCGTCGYKLSLNSDPIYRHCARCDVELYPVSCPSIIVGVYQDDRILLVKTIGGWQGHSIVAGFLEPGESLEDCVRREVYEEVGLKIKNIQYELSQSFPLSNSIMIGYTAAYDSGKINIQEDELCSGGWFKIDKLPNDIPPSDLIGGKIITLLKERILSKKEVEHGKCKDGG
jgi:NAD+ diphosphatase